MISRQEDSPEYQQTVHRFFRELTRVAGFQLSESQRRPFLAYHGFITREPKPNYLLELKKNGGRFYQLHSNGILGDTQNALASAAYHLQNVERIVSAVERSMEQCRVRQVLGRISIGGGNTIALDSEYQSFVLSVRSTLDYLTRGLAAYFKNDFHSFSKFGKFLSKAIPVAVADPLREAYERHASNFNFVMSFGDRRSTRDDIIHRQFVPAGVINISSQGMVIAGGGEKLVPRGGEMPPPLQNVLADHLQNLSRCVSDLLDTFGQAVHAFEKLALG